MPKITGLRVHDVRFPTSDFLDGSDAMHVDPDYSAAYVVLETDEPGLAGHGLTFTIGRGNEVCCRAIEAFAPHVAGLAVDDIAADMGGFWRRLAGDSQLRWLGPEKGVVHLATGAVVNAAWDLWARSVGKPVWRLVCDLTPDEIVRAIDFRHISDALSPEEARALLEERLGGREERIAQLLRDGYPAYTTSAGWLGYDDEKIRRLAREAVEAGWTHVKIKVGRDLDDDVRRARIIREEIGPDRKLMFDANQVWDVDEAIRWMRPLAEFDPLWIEEPTSPDDVLGHARIRRAVRPVGVATGEHCQNRVMWKQFFQAEAVDFCQVDACRLGGLNEVLAVLLLAAKFDVPVCPHAGGVGLCEYVQHVSAIDYACVSGTLDGRVTEFADHLHEHFTTRIEIRNGRYIPPADPGFSVEMRPESVADYTFPGGRVWSDRSRPGAIG
ncbi:MAG: L-fuconate dehydratase [Deltaproteobacteria bacterium]|nr:L-fuconate dehydratase [Deltaproteobacteria bacterium]